MRWERKRAEDMKSPALGFSHLVAEAVQIQLVAAAYRPATLSQLTTFQNALR
jgi:hypothetical protein